MLTDGVQLTVDICPCCSVWMSIAFSGATLVNRIMYFGTQRGLEELQLADTLRR